MPDDYLRVVYDTINAQNIVGSARNMLSESGRDAAMNRAQAFIQRDIQTIKSSERFTDPGTVIYLKKKTANSSKDFDVQSQGVGVLYMSTAKFHGGNAGDIPIMGSYAKLEETSSGSGVYKASITMTATYFLTYEMTRYLGNSNSNIVLSKSAGTAGNEYWYIEPINSTNYFAAAPVASFSQNDKYYTTLRTAFSYTVPTNNGNKVKAYKVTALPNVPGDLATLDEVSTVSAGFPVIIESSSLNSENNILDPCTPVAYLEADNSGSCMITPHDFDESDILYHNYGRHGHDAYNDANHSSFTGWLPEGDNIGFFKNKYPWNTSNVIYKLGIKDGAVGFWEKVGYLEEVSGNEAYSPVQCQLFPVEKDLAGIVENGAEDIIYDVTEVEDHYLYVAKVVGNTLYAKDYGRFSNPDEKPAGAIDGMSRFYNDPEHGISYNQSDYDQSNWVALTGLANPSTFENKYIHVKKGKLVNRVNPEMKVANDDDIVEGTMDTNWAPNSYCPASFMGNQVGADGKTYFFVKPKPQEVVHIVGAIYGGKNEFGKDEFYIDKPGNGYNLVQLKGGFVIDPSLLPSGTKFESDTAYEFDAVVKKVEPTTASLNATPYTGGGISNDYVVYPFSNPIVTGVQNLEILGNVVSVKYYNAMGVESDVPFKGINIVVTTYDNGTRTTSKILK